VKKILFVCATGGITSTVAEQKIIEACKEAKIEFKAYRCSAPEVSTYLKDVDFIVATAAIGDNYPIPVINGLPFLTGIGKEEVIAKILELAKAD